jgi:hypothetical protein
MLYPRRREEPTTVGRGLRVHGTAKCHDIAFGSHSAVGRASRRARCATEAIEPSGGVKTKSVRLGSARKEEGAFQALSTSMLLMALPIASASRDGGGV